MSGRIDQERYHKLAEWAESGDREIHPDRALRGRQAAEASRELLRRAGGRPSIDTDPDAAGAAPRRQVRLPCSLNTRLDSFAAEQGRSASDVMRDAIATYLDEHQGSAAR
ncbi:ribbon-helix-helix protein, CopG family [Mycolicibacterium novocastrense]|uniref:Ribbon-helix-helix protein, CopG family n=1 Tax=Mycolicibacterium novocastrense TaxID=59813 RepID=A0AAW5SU15_MYCNV|nr:ribbon-helix-helix protein, CopG family [Mycolicibacterium novocastrense]MCV7026638.1 ribbon-helix-helix protein, CopG family [Mycolicibacterium novocastrense]GAT07608.1 transcriptional regulator, CopG family [Mycolicibacterium novocastrense]